MIQIIPAIDIIEGKCVRLEQGDYRLKKVYEADPLDMALRFQDYGIKRLHMVDLDGARSKHVVNWKVLEKISSKTSLIIDFGGGVKTGKDLKIIFENGASMATIGSIAITDKDLFKSWILMYGPDKIILAADIKDRKIAITGWQKVTEIDIIDFLKEYTENGVSQVLCTDISKDGMLSGVSIDLYKNIIVNFPTVNLLASGGVTSLEDIRTLNEMGIPGVIIGKALYEGKILLHELKEFIIK
jgi:phosphoribosylformimino-5-aminoimidazole carboxamide ribotide isomerase